MRTLLLASAAAAFLAFPAPSPALAQGAPAMQRIDPSHLLANRLIDRDVYTTDRVEVGEVEDLVIDPATGRIVTVVIDVERDLGLNAKYIAVPLDRLSIAPGERRVTLNMTRAELSSLPAIDYHD
ncbi:PRC-barrel domain-containing protein [Roseomonas gilardii subsp. gilardii]|uniref:PRC-barrel domain-containing protein n=1 Tax=Roseomonas gilardii TaxID=257708 RepID=UPI001FFB089E|nr:PRC-barrel domain-containing protein [Roseomonas gilardii]UPG70948.1 PRC-barrel domain-containing protein [Roseomonas gilardii subsp. gilardii]